MKKNTKPKPNEQKQTNNIKIRLHLQQTFSTNLFLSLSCKNRRKFY